MNRNIKAATVKRFHYDTHMQLETHLRDFINAYNYGSMLRDAARSHPLRVHLQNLDDQARTIQRQPAPSNTGTKQLTYCFGARGGLTCL